jgi:tRNA A37 threonylcarbamoyladenosine dehydratase
MGELSFASLLTPCEAGPSEAQVHQVISTQPRQNDPLARLARQVLGKEAGTEFSISYLWTNENGRRPARIIVGMNYVDITDVLGMREASSPPG